MRIIPKRWECVIDVKKKPPKTELTCVELKEVGRCLLVLGIVLKTRAH